MSYFESRLRLDFKDLDELYCILKFCERLHIKNLILEPLNNSKDLREDLFHTIRESTKLKIDFRFNLKPKTINDFKNEIRLYQKLPYIISLETQEKEIQIQAAKDSRIHILSFSDPANLKTVTPGVISLAKQNNTFIEFSIAPIMIKNRAMQSKNFRLLYRFIQLIIKLKPIYIISGNFDNVYDFRHPRNLISICHTLLGMPLEEAKNGFSKNIEILLNQIKTKNENQMVQEGVRLIKEDK